MGKKTLQHYLSLFFRHLGKLIGRHPIIFLLTSISISVLLSLGILRITIRRDLFRGFINSDGKSMQDKKLVEKLFPLNVSTEYDQSRMTDEGLCNVFIVIPLDKKTIFREHIYNEMKKLDRLVRNFTVPWKDKQLNYDQLCARNYKQCTMNYGLFDNQTLKQFQNGLFTMKYPVEIDPVTYKVTPYAQNFGGVTVDDDGNVIDALAYRLFYTPDAARTDMTDVMKKWEQKALDIVQNTNFDYIKVFMISTSSKEDYARKYTENVLPLGSICVTVIMVFCMMASMTTSWVRSKPWLGISACISAILSTVTSFGIVMLCGVSYFDINIALPFLIIGMGVDDSFVLLSAWRRSNVEDTIEKRMEKTFAESAVSITITSITNLVSFCVGMITPFPVITIFCKYAAAGVFFTFLYQIIFFGSCIALTGGREENGLHPFTCQKINKGRKMNGNQAQHSTEESHKVECIMKFFGNKIGSYLTGYKVKCVVFLIYLILLSVGIWGVIQIKEGLDSSQILPVETPGYKYMIEHYKYFSKYAHRIHVVINGPLNYADPSIQKQIEITLKKFEVNPLIADPSLTESWLRAFKMFAASPVSAFSLGAFNLSNKQDFINGLRVFLRFPQTRNFQRDISFSENFTEITASRFFLLCNDVKNKKEEKDLIESIWKIADENEIPITVFSFWFPFYEQLTAIRPVAIQTVCIAVVVIMCVFFLFIPNIICAICVAITILTVEIEVIGFMSLWNISLDIFSLINLLMCVGFSINYPTHLTYAYVASDFKHEDARLQNALYAVGLPIVQGSLSTVLGVSVLVMDPSYMFRVFLKIIILAVVLTAVHSIFFLPVLLNVCDKYLNCNISKRTNFRKDVKEAKNFIN